MLVIAPLHSVTSPTVGVGYLAAELKRSGVACSVVDLNIALKTYLERQSVPRSWLEWIFPFGERTYGGELLMSQVCFERSAEEILDAARSLRNREFQEFFRRLAPEKTLCGPGASRVASLVSSFLEAQARALATQAGDWLGFSVVVTNQPAVIFLIQRLHRLRPDLRIVLGGSHFNLDNALAWARAFPVVDAVIVGEARSALLSWIRGDEKEDAPQIVRATTEAKSIRIAPLAPRTWPAADWAGIDWTTYLNVTEDLAPAREATGAAVPVMGARGCSYNRCTFCYEVLLAPHHQPRAVEQVAAEIRLQRERTGRSDFFLTDLDLNSDYQRTLELAREIRRQAPGIRFHCWLRAHELDEEILSALYEAGARSWFVGIEAVTDPLLSAMRKGYDGRHARRVIAAMRRFADKHPDVRYGFNLIPNYPGETIADVVETFYAIHAERELYFRQTAALYEFALTVNTIAWVQRERLGLGNLVGWNAVLFPAGLAAALPSHRYWYERDDPDLDERRIAWDHIRLLVGHEPQYLEPRPVSLAPVQHSQATGHCPAG